MKKVLFLAITTLILGFGALTFFSLNDRQKSEITEMINSENLGGPKMEPHPLSIEALRNGEYPGSEIVIEQELPSGSNYKRYIVSYKSEGLKIYALLTVPTEEAPTAAKGTESRRCPDSWYNRLPVAGITGAETRSYPRGFFRHYLERSRPVQAYDSFPARQRRPNCRTGPRFSDAGVGGVDGDPRRYPC